MKSIHLLYIRVSKTSDPTLFGNSTYRENFLAAIRKF
jgi:hypothetical protein